MVYRWVYDKLATLNQGKNPLYIKVIKIRFKMLIFISVSSRKGNDFSSKNRSRDWKVDRPHWVWKKPNAFLYSSEEYWSMAERLNQ